MVSRDARLCSALAAGLGDQVEIRQLDDASEAHAVIIALPMVGVVLDLDLLGLAALPLAQAFLRCQATGRAVLVEGHSGPTTLVGLSLRDPRVECLTRPLDADALGDCFKPRNRSIVATTDIH